VFATYFLGQEGRKLAPKEGGGGREGGREGGMPFRDYDHLESERAASIT